MGVSKYDPAYCEQAIALMAEGRSKAAVAGALGIHEVTLYRWVDKHPEFAEALAYGDALSAEWWEQRARDVATGKETGNASVIIFALKNRVHRHWREKIETEHSGKVEVSGIQVTFERPDPKT